MIRKAMQTTTSRICTLMVTHACNLNCVYCFERHKSGTSAKRMTFKTATAILEKEFATFAESRKKDERFAVEFFGGEPLLNFSLIKKVYDWCINQRLPFDIIFQITTNGTQLTPAVRAWLTERKKNFRVIVSVDGTELMQARNRGCNLDDIPIAFVRDTWEKSYFKMTVSRETLSSYAEGMISLTQNGYRIASSLAEGIEWQLGDEEVYRSQLLQIAEWYLAHPDIKPEHPFNFLYKGVLNEYGETAKNCGVGTSIVAYDIDGRSYPCHLFLPIVHGREDYDKISELNFSDTTNLFSDDCRECKIRNLCRTCYGYNYLIRGDIALRNKTNCRMQLVEAQVISAFETKYLMQKSKSEKLTDMEMVLLKAALSCYEQVCGLTVEDLLQ